MLKETILNELKGLLLTLNNTNRKESFYPILVNLSPLLKDFISQVGGNMKNLRMDSLETSTRKNLEMISHQCSVIDKDKRAGLLAKISLAEQSLNRWLDDNSIGRIKSFYVNQNGRASVTLSCKNWNIDTFGNKKFSKEQKFQRRIKKMKEKGFLIEQENPNSFYFLISEQNMELMTKLLKDIGAKGIQFSTRGKEISEISFSILADNLVKLETPEIDTDFPITDTLNADEAYYIRKCVKGIASAINDIEELPNIKNDGCQVIASYYSDLCKTVGMETELSKEYYQIFEAVKKENQLLKEKRKYLQEKSKNVDIRKDVFIIYEKLCSWMSANFNFDIVKFEIYPYGTIKIECSYNSSNYTEYKFLDETELKSMFDTNHGSQEEENLFLLDSEKNKHKIKEKIDRMFHDTMTVTSWYSELKNDMILKKFSTEINDLYRLIKIMDPYEVEMEMDDDL